jgi:ELWxxDGT repeat protein
MAMRGSRSRRVGTTLLIGLLLADLGAWPGGARAAPPTAELIKAFGFYDSLAQLTNVNGTLFFAANDLDSGTELWKSDGTAAGTVRVKDIWPGLSRGSNPAFLTNVNGTLFFTADDGRRSWRGHRGPWKSDGAAAGTVLVKDIDPRGDPSPRWLTNVDGTLFFTADDGRSGFELWKSDGTAAGTIRVTGMGPRTSNPAFLTNVNGTLFFAATTDGLWGPQLWAVFPHDRLVTGAGGAPPQVRAFDARSGAETGSVLPFPAAFGGGVRVAAADLTGDGLPDLIVGAGPGATPQVRVLDGATGASLRSFLPYPPSFRGGVFVAVGDVTGDGVPDIATGPGPGMEPLVRVFDGRTGAPLRSFLAYASSFRGGVTVAAGDVTGDGRAELVTGVASAGPPEVRVFDGRTGTLRRRFLAYAPTFLGGVFVAAGDVTGDGRADLVTGPGPGMLPEVRVFDGRTGALRRRFLAFDPGFLGGVRVGVAFVTRDGKADLLAAAGPGALPQVDLFDGATGARLGSFLPYPAEFRAGVFVAGSVR